MITKTRNLRCFVSAPAGTDLSQLLDALQEHNICILDPAEFAPGAVTITEKLIDGISHADLFVAVLGTASSSANVFFELGCASALNKQILVVAPEGIDIPSDIKDLLYIRTTPNNREALNFALEQILNAPRQEEVYRNRLPDKSKPLGAMADILLQRLTALGTTPRDYDIQNIVQDMLEASGISTHVKYKYPNIQLDFVVWVDELEPYFGNPLLIEVKGQLDTAIQAKDTIEQVLHYVALSNARAVIVFVPKISSGATDVISGYPTLYFFNLYEFLERLREESFGQIIRKERNARVHGRLR